MSVGIDLDNVSVSGIDIISKSRYLKHILLRKDSSNIEIPILKNISLSINEGEKVGFIGVNGSGKSSLLKVISGIYPPKSGKVSVRGSISAIIEMGLGFDLELSGIDNIKLGLVYQGGISCYNKENERKIIEFSELGEKIHLPLKCYSSGMIARLAFSISAFANAEILLLDEVFAAGDIGFVEKSSKYMKSKLENSSISILVSHSSNIILDNCNRCIWFENGQIIADDDAKYVIKEYQRKCNA